MELNNCQYYKLVSPIEEIAKLKVNKINYKLIEDIDVGDTIPNVLVYFYKDDNKPNYNNIFPSVKILITNNQGLKNGLWKEIPEYIEYIINENRIYKNNRDKFDFIYFENKEEQKKIIHQLINEGRINERNIYGGTVLHLACYLKMQDESIKLIDRMSDEAINKYDNYRQSSFYWAFYYKNPDVAIKLIDRMSDEAINKLDNFLGRTLRLGGFEKMSNVEIKLKDRMSKARY